MFHIAGPQVKPCSGACTLAPSGLYSSSPDSSYQELSQSPALRSGYPLVLSKKTSSGSCLRVWLSLTELKRPWTNLDISLGSRGDQKMPMCQVTTYSQGPVLCQKPCQVQSNLACPCPHLALALKDTAGRLGDTGLQQQSNLQLPVGRSQGRIREPFVQQSNLCFRGTASPHLQNSCLPPAGPSSHQKQTFQVAGCLDLRLSEDLAPLDGCTWPGPRPWCRSGSWAPRLVGEPLTLEDLSVSDHSQSQASTSFSCSTAHWLLDSTQHLEPESQTSWEHLGLTQRGPHNCGGQSTPAQSWPSHSRESLSFLETLEVQARFSESPIYMPLLHEATLGTLAGDFSDSDHEVLSSQYLGARERGPPGFLFNKRHRGHFSVTLEERSKETRLESPGIFSVLPGQEGRERAPEEKTGRDGERMASCPSNIAPAQSTTQNEAQNIVTLDSQTACRKLLSESFRVWRRLSQRRQAVAKATAMRHRQLIRKSLRELHWVLWLQKTRLEAAWEQQAKALLARSFREWRHVALRQKLEQPHTQAVPTFLASRGSLSLERKAAADLAWRCRCFRAWQRLAQRGAQYRRHLAHRRVRTLRACLGQWMEMKRLQASDVTKVTQLALHWLKAGNEVLSGLAPGAAMAHCLETVTHAQQLSKGPDQCSLWEICQKLALYRTLLLWRTRFYQRQQTGAGHQELRLIPLSTCPPLSYDIS
eukprot:XP_006539414.1 PREDICTED: uncharacterized protein C1orf167 homolog isoform X4 [Mus musculus]